MRDAKLIQQHYNSIVNHQSINMENKNSYIETVGKNSIHPYAYAGLFRREPLTLKALERVVCEAMGVEAEQLRRKTRQRAVCFPRQVFYYFACANRSKLPPAEGTVAAIGAYYGQNHATVLHAANALIPNLLETDRKTREACSSVAQELSQRYRIM